MQITTATFRWLLNIKPAAVLVCILGWTLFTSVALTNITVLCLILVAPFAWIKFANENEFIDRDTKFFLALVLALCTWDILCNLFAGHGLGASLSALLHGMRKFGFVVVLWAIFSKPSTARIAFWSVCSAVLVLATVNLLMTLSGIQAQGKYFTTEFMHLSHMSHMYGQALVGLVFVLAQMLLVRPSFSWRLALPIFLLVMSLFLASERRTGYILLIAGFALWTLLNAKRLDVSKYKWWFLLALIAAVIAAANSGVVHKRMTQVWVEVNEYLVMSPQERVNVIGAVRIRMQYVSTVIEAIKQSNWLIGVGSIDLPDAYQAAAIKMGLEPGSNAWNKYNWSNPHNEYLYMLATNGAVGLVLYLMIFAQACRVGWSKADEVQRVSLVMFVFLFMLSISTNSMMIDMQEGHFAMLILLVFLAPKSLDLLNQR